jgi:hypothetical protein
LAVDMWIYFWVLYFFPFFYALAVVPVQCYLGYYNFVAYFEVRCCDPSSFVSLAQDLTTWMSIVPPNEF